MRIWGQTIVYSYVDFRYGGRNNMYIILSPVYFVIMAVVWNSLFTRFYKSWRRSTVSPKLLPIVLCSQGILPPSSFESVRTGAWWSVLTWYTTVYIYTDDGVGRFHHLYMFLLEQSSFFLIIFLFPKTVLLLRRCATKENEPRRRDQVRQPAQVSESKKKQQQ